MSMKMSVDAYKELLEGNKDWLSDQPSSCERSHIMGILVDSTNYYYPENYNADLLKAQNDTKELVEYIDLSIKRISDIPVFTGYAEHIVGLLEDARVMANKHKVVSNE